MATKRPPSPARKPRADARQNRERILEVAKEAFTESGASASLDDIATRAGKLAAAERRFAETMPPLEALRAWMLLFVDHIAAKQIIAPALNTIVGGPAKLYEGSRGQIQGAIEALVNRAIESGQIRKDVESSDLLRALIGVAHVTAIPDWQQSAKRLVDILIAGSRTAR